MVPEDWREQRLEAGKSVAAPSKTGSAWRDTSLSGANRSPVAGSPGLIGSERWAPGAQRRVAPPAGRPGAPDLMRTARTGRAVWPARVPTSSGAELSRRGTHAPSPGAGLCFRFPRVEIAERLPWQPHAPGSPSLFDAGSHVRRSRVGRRDRGRRAGGSSADLGRINVRASA